LNYSELFSAFGYQAIDIILDIDISELQETELRKLVSLITHVEKKTLTNEQLAEIMELKGEASVKIQRLLSLADSLNND
jgi:hypothetical protein